MPWQISQIKHNNYFKKGKTWHQIEIWGHKVINMGLEKVIAATLNLKLLPQYKLGH